MLGPVLVRDNLDVKLTVVGLEEVLDFKGQRDDFAWCILCELMPDELLVFKRDSYRVYSLVFKMLGHPVLLVGWLHHLGMFLKSEIFSWSNALTLV